MLHKIFENQNLASIRLGTGKRTIHNWLEGVTPNGFTMIAIITKMDIDVDVYYVEAFFEAIRNAIEAETIEEINAVINRALINSRDKSYLKDYYKKQYWKVH